MACEETDAHLQYAYNCNWILLSLSVIIFFSPKPANMQLVFGYIKYKSNFCNEIFKQICKSKKPKPSLDKLDYSANSQLESMWHFQKN